MQTAIKEQSSISGYIMSPEKWVPLFVLFLGGVGIYIDMKIEVNTLQQQEISQNAAFTASMQNMNASFTNSMAQINAQIASMLSHNLNDRVHTLEDSERNFEGVTTANLAQIQSNINAQFQTLTAANTSQSSSFESQVGNISQSLDKLSSSVNALNLTVSTNDARVKLLIDKTLGTSSDNKAQ